jgi:hypothetical protein
MLAYVFWHWRNDSVSRDEYESDLRDFHQTLALNKPAGFRGSTVFSLESAEWLNAPETAYEEWYLLDDSAAMDPLNHAAVHDACEEPHNRVARNSAGGTGGLYRLRIGIENLAKARFATWLSKPQELSYSDFYRSLESPATQQGFALWGRQMTLGPTTEFCIHSQTQTTLPPQYNGKIHALNLSWTERD